MKKSWRYPARREEIANMAGAVGEFARADGWSSELEFKVELAVEELGLNIISYSGLKQEETFEMVIEATPQSVLIEFSDSGIAFDPLRETASPDVDASLEERPIGGLGVFLCVALAESIHYRREADRNYLDVVISR